MSAAEKAEEVKGENVKGVAQDDSAIGRALMMIAERERGLDKREKELQEWERELAKRSAKLHDRKEVLDKLATSEGLVRLEERERVVREKEVRVGQAVEENEKLRKELEESRRMSELGALLVEAFNRLVEEGARQSWKEHHARW